MSDERAPGEEKQRSLIFSNLLTREERLRFQSKLRKLDLDDPRFMDELNRIRNRFMKELGIELVGSTYER